MYNIADFQNGFSAIYLKNKSVLFLIDFSRQFAAKPNLSQPLKFLVETPGILWYNKKKTKKGSADDRAGSITKKEQVMVHFENDWDTL